MSLILPEVPTVPPPTTSYERNETGDDAPSLRGENATQPVATEDAHCQALHGLTHKNLLHVEFSSVYMKITALI